MFFVLCVMVMILVCEMLINFSGCISFMNVFSFDGVLVSLKMNDFRVVLIIWVWKVLDI